MAFQFYGIPKCENKWTFSWAVFFFFFFCLFVLFQCANFIFLKILHFYPLHEERQKRDGSNWDRRWEKRGGVEGGKAINRMYCIKKKNLFSKKEKRYVKCVPSQTDMAWPLCTLLTNVNLHKQERC